MESIEKLFPHDLQDKILILVIAVYFSNSVARSKFSFPLEKVETNPLGTGIEFAGTEYIHTIYNA